MDTNTTFYKLHGKRIIDLIMSIVALIVLAPVMLLTAILVRKKLGKPIIFKQLRPGLNEKIFTLYKFRTMTDQCDKDGKPLPDSVRLTPFGKFLRSTSLDELPEIFNILKGEMSFVGPRPQLVRDMVFMTDEQRQRHTVIPGLTGWAQINGRNNASWESRLSYDLQYIENISLIHDFEIIFKTFFKVFMRKDVNTEGMDTSEDLCDHLLNTGKVTKEKYIELNQEAINLINNYKK